MKRKTIRHRASLYNTALLAATVFVASSSISAADTPFVPLRLSLLALADNAMVLTHRLLHESSATKNILASDNAKAKALYSEAIAFYQRAAKANASGDERARNQALKKAKTSLFKAAKLAGVGRGLNDHSHDMYKRRERSTSALLDAHRRIRKELKAGAKVRALESRAIADITAAHARFEKDDVPAATQLLDRALNALKGSLISMRNGTTLVRTLHFDTPRDEYEYERGRNQSHTLLTRILLQKNPLPENAKQRFDKDMSQAGKLRQVAETQAAKGKYKTAIKTLEESTRHIMHAIRSAGVYIPG